MLRGAAASGARVEARRNVVSEVFRAGSGKAAHGFTMPPERPISVASDVRGDAGEPRPDHRLIDDDVIPATKSLKKGDCSQILGLRPVAQPAEEVVVDPASVALVEKPERFAVSGPDSRPESVIASFVSQGTPAERIARRPLDVGCVDLVPDGGSYQPYGGKD